MSAKKQRLALSVARKYFDAMHCDATRLATENGFRLDSLMEIRYKIIRCN
jgi:hypothetical protein